MVERSSQGPEVTLGALGDMATRIERVFERVGTLRSEIGKRFAEDYSAWLEDAELSLDAFVAGLRLDSLRFTEAAPEAIAYLRHAAFANHFVEVVLSKDDALIAVSLQG